MTDLQSLVVGSANALLVALVVVYLLMLFVDWMRFPPVFLARRFAYFRWKRLLAWSRMYNDLFGSASSVEYFVDFLEDVGEDSSLLEWAA